MGLPIAVSERLREVVVEICSRAKQSGKRTAFCIGTTMNVGNEEYFVSSIRETPYAVCGNIMISHVEDLEELTGLLDGKVEEILVDVEKKRSECGELGGIVRRCAQKSSISYFRGNAIAAEAFEHFFVAYCTRRGIDFSNRRACIIGVGHLGAKLVCILAEYGLRVDVYDQDAKRAGRVVSAANIMVARASGGEAGCIQASDIRNRRYFVLVGGTNGIPVITAKMLDVLEEDGFVLDAGLGTVTQEAISRASAEDLPVLCLIAKPGFDGMMITRREAGKIVASIGRLWIEEGFSLVSGGVVGAYGDVIVDNAVAPTRVIGIARGDGLVLSGSDKDMLEDRISLVRGKYVQEERV